MNLKELQLKKIIILAFLSFNAFSQIKSENYQKARNQNILEYTVFGIDECIKLNQSRFVVDEETAFLDSDKVIIGTQDYFLLLSNCFRDLSKNCEANNCIVSKSMGKRIENVKHLDLIMSKYKDEKILTKSIIKE